MSASKKVRVIMEDYKKLLEETLCEEREALLADISFCDGILKGVINRELVKKTIISRGSIFNPKGEINYYSAADLQYLSVQASEFWTEYGTDLINHIRDIERDVLSVISPSRLDELSHLPIYFDSILIEDTFETSNAHPDRDHLYFDVSKQLGFNQIERWVDSLSDYICTYHILNSSLQACTESLIYIIFPRSATRNKVDFNAKQELSLRAMNLTDRIVKEKLNLYNVPEEMDLKDYFSSLNESQVINLLKRLVQSGEWTEVLASLSQVGYETTMMYCSANNIEKVNGKLVLFLYAKFEKIRLALILEQSSSSLNAIRGSSISEWQASLDLMSISQREFCGELGWSDEYAALMTMQHENLNWLHNIPFSAIRSLRVNEDMEEMRSFFRSTNRRICNSSMEEYSRVTESISKEFNDLLNQEEERLAAEKNKYVKKLGLSSTSFATGLTLGISTAIFPALAPLSIPAAIASSLIGTSSARELINMHISRKRKISGLNDRPISILLSAKSFTQSE